MNNYITYKKFQNIEQAEETMDLLKENNIPFIIENNSKDVHGVLMGADMEPQFLLKIESFNFNKSNHYCPVKLIILLLTFFLLKK